MCLKYIRLKLGRFKRKIFSRLLIILSYILLGFSALVSLIILIPNYFNQVPTLSYYIKKYELPITYELYGEVKVLDENSNIVNKNVEVFVGGYSTSILMSTEFYLTFSSPVTNEIFVIIRYEIDGEICEYIKCLTFEEGNNILREEFIIYV